MRRTIRPGVMIALVLGLGVAGAAARAEEPPARKGAEQGEVRGKDAAPPSDPAPGDDPPAPGPRRAQDGAAVQQTGTRHDPAPGAAGMEPFPSAGEEDSVTRAHRAWVESIWRSP